MAITVEGKKYKVLEDLRYQCSVGAYAKVVMTDTGWRIAVKSGKTWRFHKPVVIFTNGGGVFGQNVEQTLESK